MSDKTILEQWRSIAYDQQADRNKLQRFWANYFNIEKGIYEQLLSNPDEVVTGTVKSANLSPIPEPSQAVPMCVL